MNAFVLDASTAISWCFEEIQTPYANAVLDMIVDGAQAHVPSIWPLEVTNALVKAFRRQHITREEMLDYARQLAGFHVMVDTEGTERAFDQILTLAQRHQLTTYDASYLELAQRKNLPLATTDSKMMETAAELKVDVFSP